jgi:hypothetical protein
MDLGGFFSNIVDGVAGAGAAVASGGLSAVLGGITGVVGGWLKNRHDLKVMALKSRERQKERDHDIKIMDKEASAAEALATISMEEKKFAADMDTLKESIKADRATYSEKWADKISGWPAAIAAGFMSFVDFIRGLIRPSVTVYFCYQLARLWRDVKATFLIKMSENAELGNVLAVRIVDTILFLAGTSVGWWFGTRPPKPVDKKI